MSDELKRERDLLITRDQQKAVDDRRADIIQNFLEEILNDLPRVTFFVNWMHGGDTGYDYPRTPSEVRGENESKTWSHLKLYHVGRRD